MIDNESRAHDQNRFALAEFFRKGEVSELPINQRAAGTLVFVVLQPADLNKKVVAVFGMCRITVQRKQDTIQLPESGNFPISRLIGQDQNVTQCLIIGIHDLQNFCQKLGDST